MSSGLHAPPYLRWELWIRKKKWQVWKRTHLSHFLAGLLGVLVLIREGPELFILLNRFLIGWVMLVISIVTLFILFRYIWILVARSYVRRSTHVRFILALIPLVALTIWKWSVWLWVITGVPFFEWLILTVTLGTIVAAIWEFRGNKLTSSPQEIRFVLGVRWLLGELETFCFAKEPGKVTSLDQLLRLCLEISRNALCGSTDVDAGFMLKADGDYLELVRSSRDAPYPAKLQIPLPGGDRQTGPAGIAFDKTSIVYVPEKDGHEAWAFESIGDEQYRVSTPQIAWVPAPTPEQENFQSSLCVPVSVYSERGPRARIGVVAFSTKKCDPFVPRDFLMAECFASILSQAIAFKQRMAAYEKKLVERSS